MLTWSACEAATRLFVADQENSEAGIHTPDYYLDQAAFLGLISREEYRHLAKARKYRNAIVHGFRHDHFSDALATDLIETVRRMMATE